jgi:hypothetical protein
MTANPSVERTAKGLRPSSAVHVKRQAQASVCFAKGRPSGMRRQRPVISLTCRKAVIDPMRQLIERRQTLRCPHWRRRHPVRVH